MASQEPGTGKEDGVQTFDSDGVRLAFIDEGEGDPVLLIHGFASSVRTNWIEPGWVSLLTSRGFRVVAFDNRGHGESEKLYDRALYSAPLMAEDARRLMDHLAIRPRRRHGLLDGRAHHGVPRAQISRARAQRHLRRTRRQHGAADGRHRARSRNALEAASIDDVKNPTARTFRAFAEKTGSDLKALAACIRGSREPITREMVASLTCPVLVATGTEDVIGGSAEELASLIPGAEALPIPRRDHMLAVGDRVYKEGVLAFLQRRP